MIVVVGVVAWVTLGLSVGKGIGVFTTGVMISMGGDAVVTSVSSVSSVSIAWAACLALVSCMSSNTSNKVVAKLPKLVINFMPAMVI